MRKHDAVNHPVHYTSHPSGVECIEFTHAMGFLLGNAFKYVWRKDMKNGTEDLRKAAWYVREYLSRPKPGPLDRVARHFAKMPTTCLLDPDKDAILVSLVNGWKYDDRELLKLVHSQLERCHE